ncbi:MAG TPA: DUF4397 domain-containing protein [Kofleriaceae bacterium]|nr:DUF4397 domain-containing protein [Kofleriaceae bacterium]
MRKSLAVCLLASGCGTVADSPSTTAARVRVAHVSPGAPAVDFCLAPHGTTAFTGPILAGAGRAAGLSYATVTRYFDVDAVRYDVRLVAPGAASCTQPLAGLDDFTRLPELAAGASVTIAAEGTLGGQGDAAFTLRGYVDDAEAPAGQARLRLIHASPGTPPVDAGTGGGAAFAPVFQDVAYGEASAVATAPLADALISARAHGSADDVLALDHTSLPAGAVATAFAIGQLGAGAAAPLRVLLCVDNAEPNGVHAACSVVGDAPHNAQLRIAHLSPDTPAVDVCVARAGAGFGAPLLRSLGATGLSYAQVTAYVELPAASYDVRVVHASAAGCATPVIPDTKALAVTAELTATIAAIGDLEPVGADPALRLAVLVDAASVTAGKTKLRVVHASPGTPPVDVGTGTGAGFQRLFTAIAFGKIAVHPPLEDGYLESAPLAQATVTARVAGTTTDALSFAHATFDAGAIATVFAVGGKTGQSANPLRFLVCRDSHPADGLLASCAIAP